MPVSEIYFWEAEINPHRVPLTRALARREDVGRVVYIAQTPLNEARVQQGLHFETTGMDEVILTPSPADIERIIAESTLDSVHVFSGMHWVPCITEGIKAAIRHGRFFGLMSEPRVLEGWKGKLRLLHSWTQEWGHRRHAAFVAAIGRHGPHWFRLTGYGDRVFPFAYFIDPPLIAAAPRTPAPRERLRIGYVGRLNEFKGFGVFLQMIEAAQGRFDFVIAGHGAMSERARHCAAHCENVTFMGVVPSAEVASVMAGFDCLIVPSKTTDDGWASVAVEALFVGTLPILNERVGASVLANGNQIAVSIEGDDPQSYLAAIEAAEGSAALSAPGRARRVAYSYAHLSADVGAAYLLETLEHFRGGAPLPPPYYC